eukprot:5446774-Amphidinium_carterae.1
MVNIKSIKNKYFKLSSGGIELAVAAIARYDSFLNCYSNKEGRLRIFNRSGSGRGELLRARDFGLHWLGVSDLLVELGVLDLLVELGVLDLLVEP